MRCRYCGKELALLKRLTGGGGFCSEAHKQSYQDEYNQLGLSRLLQAHKKGGETESSGKNTAPPVATEEPAAKEPVAKEPLQKERPTNTIVTGSASLRISSLEASIAEDSVTRDTAAEAPAKPPAEPAAEPLEIASFLRDSPAVSALPETPHLEPWLEFSSGPAVADWQFQDEVPTLSTATPVSLALGPNVTLPEHSVVSANLTPREFENGHGRPSPPWQVTVTHQLPSAGPVSIEVNASAVDFAADRSIAGELGFQTAVLVEDSQLLEL